jgi:hypothetical protein
MAQGGHFAKGRFPVNAKLDFLIRQKKCPCKVWLRLTGPVISGLPSNFSPVEPG